jgi:ABC-type Mn2+/Zn2+ transport system permease subunit
MTMRLINILCVVAVILAVSATVLGLVNAGHFDWKPIARGASIVVIVLVAYSSARAKALKQSREGAGKAQGG